MTPRFTHRPKADPGHPCAAVACQHLVQRGFLMCMDHWRQVPTKLKSEVLRTYRALKAGPALMQRQMDYANAVKAAVEAVRQKQLKKKDARDASTRPLF